jgi:hypothetical protein
MRIHSKTLIAETSSREPQRGILLLNLTSFSFFFLTSLSFVFVAAHGPEQRESQKPTTYIPTVESPLPISFHRAERWGNGSWSALLIDSSPVPGVTNMEAAVRVAELPSELRYIQYEHGLEKQYLPAIRALISKDLSEPYSIYVYRYFLYQWAHLCYMVSVSFCAYAIRCDD